MFSRILKYMQWSVTIAASGAAILTYIFPPTPTSLPGIERALTKIANNFPEVSQQITDPQTLSNIADSSARIATSSIRELSEADAVIYRVTEGVFDLKPYETVEVTAAGSSPIPLSVTKSSSPNAFGRTFHFDGASHKIHIGRFLAYETSKETCRLLFVAGLENSAVRMKWSCMS